MRNLLPVIALAALSATCPRAVHSQDGHSDDSIVLHVERVAPHGIALGRVELTAAARWCGIERVEPARLAAVSVETGRRVPMQFVPDVDFDAVNNVRGTVVVQLPAETESVLRLAIDDAKPTTPSPRSDPATPAPDALGAGLPTPPGDATIAVATDHYKISHAPGRMGGLPFAIEFPASGKVFDGIRWHDRLHHRESGGWWIKNDARATVERIGDGPLCSVARTAARYVQSNQAQHASRPRATYQWFYFHRLPLVLVTLDAVQAEPAVWHEHHFLELNFPDESFVNWVGGEPRHEGTFSGSQESFNHTDWAALVDGDNAIGMVRCGRAIIHDGRGGYGCYLHARGAAAWRGWSDTRRRQAAWLWIGTDENPIGKIAAAQDAVPDVARVTVTTDSFRRRIAAADRKAPATSLAESLVERGRFEQAARILDGDWPDGWTPIEAGPLHLTLAARQGGITLESLFDADAGIELSAADRLPLFELKLREVGSGRRATLAADAGWTDCTVAGPDAWGRFHLRWRAPADEWLGGLSVELIASPDAETGSVRWQLAVENASERWSLMRAVFPQVALRQWSDKARLLFPRGPGEEFTGPWSKDVRYTGTYPNGWTAMQMLAAYDGEGKTGLYVGMHDPHGGTKDIRVETRVADRTAVLAFDHPVPDMSRPGNSFHVEGHAHWQRLPGDWFDAAMIYRDWVTRHARWYPKTLGIEGRKDTPTWMRRLPAWALGGGRPADCEDKVRQFAGYLGTPIGMHWYNWHQIPFDNDYPHYFPAKDGFSESVARLRTSGVFVMPYINGRLWDTRDRGMDDFEFTRRALASATKNEKGEPHTETYGATESDGSKVRLAVMCPTTPLWRETMRTTVDRLTCECGVAGVYIDQIAAAGPKLCFDASHGHPLGGGHWWNEGYWTLLRAVGADLPEDRMLTSECNAEPFMHLLDGYLTWHWQHDDQVPVFPAVYGGAIAMFGRAYRGGETKDLALRMKAGQQLCFGEQIGWIGPGVVDEKENAAFLRQTVRLRSRLGPFFYAGRMARPPRPSRPVPTVRADWQWAGIWPVENDALLTAAWQLPHENRLAVIAINTSGAPIESELEFDEAKYGFSTGKITITPVQIDRPHGSAAAPKTFQPGIAIPADTAWAWEVRGVVTK